MELTWVEYLLYGAISGFTEFLPISAVAHQAVFTALVGGADFPWLRLSCHIGSLAALIFVFVPNFSRMRRERKIARLPKSRRRRQPDYPTMMEIRVFRTTSLTVLPAFLAYPYVHNLYERFWLLAIFLGINGIILYLPQRLPTANKRAENLSSLDGWLIGLCGGLGIVPGFSRVGTAVSVAQIRGVERRYAADIALMLSIPALIVLSVMDCFAGAAGGFPASALSIFGCITAAAASCIAAYFGIFLLRFLAVKSGFTGFSYYCWGLALFTLIIYLI